MRTNKRTLLFLLVVLLQVVLLLVIPLSRRLALTTGRTVVLETAPIDPYSAFRGYYVTLNYQISSPNNLPFTDSHLKPVEGRNYYVWLKPDADGIWHPYKVSVKPPANLGSNRTAIKGRYRSQWLMEYGIEQYYLPETKRLELENLLNKRNQKILVKLKVGQGGQGAITGLQVGGRSFRY
jgi:uncharacterized membrane-anchored protein